MAEKRNQKDRQMVTREEAFLDRAIKRVRLAWRLFRDKRVSFGLKLIPIGGALYVLSPIDFLPDAVLGLGQLDDIGVILLTLNLFIEMCPKEVVDEIQRRLKGQAPTPPPESEEDNPGIVEGEFRVL